MTPPTRITGAARARRSVAAAVVVVVALLVIALIADLITASRAEHRMARALMSSPMITYEPEVVYSGRPFLTEMSSGALPKMTISARGVGIDDCGDLGACTVDVGARLYHPTVGNVWSVSPTSPIHFHRMVAETRVNSPNLGRLMNIIDLYINSPAPKGKVGGGGPGDGLIERTDGVMLSGTVPLPGSPPYDGKYPPSASEYRHPKVKVSVTARVFVKDGRLRIQATDFYTGPEEHFSDDVPPEFRSRVLKLFSTTLPILPMAWKTPPTSAFTRGSDLILAGDAPSGTVTPGTY
ncbi:DUF2993 domain-containing protein [Gordonia sp. (in: high G+C Gram-positive bacteria)]|uniref:LmeA family phospholipid-binding protein n=1 Tax=Gordonia sp. (in: high G+C Gram-positive bacteria) TaxID=84139 RepID=UPI0035273542